MLYDQDESCGARAMTRKRKRGNAICQTRQKFLYFLRFPFEDILYVITNVNFVCTDPKWSLCSRNFVLRNLPLDISRHCRHDCTHAHRFLLLMPLVHLARCLPNHWSISARHRSPQEQSVTTFTVGNKNRGRKSR
jgi:hypothetical protein